MSIACKFGHDTLSFIPPFFEHQQIIERTVRAALAIDWPADKLTVLLLDDGGSPGLLFGTRNHVIALNFIRCLNAHTIKCTNTCQQRPPSWSSG